MKQLTITKTIVDGDKVYSKGTIICAACSVAGCWEKSMFEVEDEEGKVRTFCGKHHQGYGKSSSGSGYLPSWIWQ